MLTWNNRISVERNGCSHNCLKYEKYRYSSQIKHYAIGRESDIRVIHKLITFLK